MELNEPVLALLAAVFGGAGLKIIEALISRSTRKTDLAKELREELRQEALDLRKQITDIESRLDKWKRQYYSLLVAFNELMAVAMGAGLAEEAKKIREELDQED